MPEYYFTVDEDRSHEIKIQRSRFITAMRHVTTMEDAKAFISEISALHKQANHNCWAYVLGDRGEIFHASDAGEPSGTAGKPMLNALKRHDLTNIAAVVTRYFGGIKLGIRGLIEAYGQAVEECIQVEALKKIVHLKRLTVEVDYGFAESLKHKITSLNGTVAEATYTDHVTLVVEVEEKDSLPLTALLNELRQSGAITCPDSDDQ